MKLKKQEEIKSVSAKVDKQINYLGLLRSPVSWAKIGRELCAELYHLCNLSIVEQKGFLFDKNLILKEEIVSSISKKRNTEYEISFIYPPLYKRMKGKKKMAGLVYETSFLPEKWVNSINKEIDILWLPNEFNRKIAIDSGVNIPIIIAPYGVNTHIFKDHQIQKKTDDFNFLCIAMPQKRKSLKELIISFYNEFKTEKNVYLTIKMPYFKKNFEFEYEPSEIHNIIKDSRVKLLIGQSTDMEISYLLSNSDCYIQSSMSEGFGMVILEAMACKTPVISTAYGGTAEFLNHNNSLIIEHEIVKAKSIQYDNDSKNAKIGKPLIESISKNMRIAYENRDLLERNAINALSTVKKYSWKKTAEKLIASLI